LPLCAAYCSTASRRGTRYASISEVEKNNSVILPWQVLHLFFIRMAFLPKENCPAILQSYHLANYISQFIMSASVYISIYMLKPIYIGYFLSTEFSAETKHKRWCTYCIVFVTLTDLIRKIYWCICILAILVAENQYDILCN